MPRAVDIKKPVRIGFFYAQKVNLANCPPSEGE